MRQILERVRRPRQAARPGLNAHRPATTGIGANRIPPVTAPKSCPDTNPMGYCGLGGTGVSCPIGLDVPAQTGALAPGSEVPSRA
jgi:hypothetical protein